MCGDLALAFGVALARVRFPQAGRDAPSTSASLALRATLGPRGARPLRLRWSSRSLTLAATVPNVFNEVIACACLALASGIALEAPQPFWPDTVLRQHPHRRRCAPRLRTCRVRPLRRHRSPCSLTLAATVPGGSRWRFPAELQGSAGTGNRPTIRKPCSTFASAMRGSAMLRLRRSPRPLSPAPTVTSASTEMNVWRSRARLRRRAGARPLSSGRTGCCGNVCIAGAARRACGLAVSGLSNVTGRHAR